MKHKNRPQLVGEDDISQEERIVSCIEQGIVLLSCS